MADPTPVLSVDEVRAYVSDYAPNNYLLDGEEFSDSFISLCISLGVDEYNVLPPIGNLDIYNFPSKALLLYGTLWKMFDGKAALLARNTMSYSDGGLQIPIEERAELYRSLAASFQQQFLQSARSLKTAQNMEDGWGNVFGDQSLIPYW